MKKLFRNNGLSIVLLMMFIISFVAMTVAGHANYNEDQADHGKPEVNYFEYLGSGNFMEAVMENMESEFLQIFFYVLLTAFLFQKGSAESKDPDKPEEENELEVKKDSPWPVKKGGIYLKVYENSMAGAFLILFIISFVLHGMGGAVEYNDDQLSHGRSAIHLLQYFFTSRFWFESFQNWQSEFFSIAAVVVFSVFLRQKDSPESKKVNAANSETGK